MPLPTTIMAVRDIGDTDVSYWLPASDDGSTLHLEHGETILFNRRATIKVKHASTVTLEDTHLAITGRRIAWVTTEFDKGGGWVGFGAVGLATALVANQVSKTRATKRRAGKVAIGHMRFEWVTDVHLRRVKALLGGASTPFLDITCATENGPATITIQGYQLIPDPTLATWIAQLAASAHLALGAPGTTHPQRYDLQQASAGAPKSPTENDAALAEYRWHLHGDTAPMIDAAYAAVSEHPQDQP